MRSPLIFVTNDDGIASPGLRAAVEAVLPLGDVLVVAPSEQQTSMGRSMPPTDGVLHPVEYEVNGRHVPAYHIHGAPAQAVLYGLLVLSADRKPDVLVSGVNYGENLGTGITISGTVGAALQGASMGVPSLAVSLETSHEFHYHHGEVDWHAAVHFTRVFTERLLTCPMPFDVDVLKVDIPSDATPETPWELTRLARHSYYESYVESPLGGELIGGKVGYRVGVRPEELEPGTDVYAFLIERVVSVTPLSLDMTSRVDFGQLQPLLLEGAPCERKSSR